MNCASLCKELAHTCVLSHGCSLPADGELLIESTAGCRGPCTGLHLAEVKHGGKAPARLYCSTPFDSIDVLRGRNTTDVCERDSIACLGESPRSHWNHRLGQVMREYRQQIGSLIWPGMLTKSLTLISALLCYKPAVAASSPYFKDMPDTIRLM